jgi:hypothetical protein
MLIGKADLYKASLSHSQINELKYLSCHIENHLMQVK